MVDVPSLFNAKYDVLLLNSVYKTKNDASGNISTCARGFCSIRIVKANSTDGTIKKTRHPIPKAEVAEHGSTRGP